MRHAHLRVHSMSKTTVLRPSERLPRSEAYDTTIIREHQDSPIDVTAIESPPPNATPLPESSSTQRIGKYAIVEELGRGGMGIVYKAYDTALKRIVALKMILDPTRAGPEIIERFKNEAAAVARLNDPRIISVFEVGEHEGKPYLVMEFLDGQSFEHYLRSHKVPAKKVAELVREIALALQHAHENCIVHRDMKPENIFIDKAGRPHLMDFGLAQDLAATHRLTVTGQLIGTPAYMAPEQASGDIHKQGPKTDVYGLGAVLYRALVGKLPFHASSVQALIQKILHEDASAPRRLVPKLHRDLETITLRCLAKEPERRYASAGDVAEELRRFLDGESIVARPVSRTEKVWLWVRRNRKRAGLLAVASLAVIVASGMGGARFLEKRSRRLAVEQVIALARDGKLDSPRAHAEAVDTVTRLADAQSAAIVARALDGVTAELGAETRAIYVAAATPKAAEVAGGAKPIEGLVAAVDRWLALAPGETLAPADAELLGRARRRIEDRAAVERTTVEGKQATTTATRILALLQEERLGPAGLELAAFACEALGKIGLADGAPALARYLAAEADEHRAAKAGEALCLLRAASPVLDARKRFGTAGPFWRDVAPLLSSAVVSASWKAVTPRELEERGTVRSLTGDLAGALADLDAVMAVETTTTALVARGRVLAGLGRTDGALASLSAAIERSPRDAEALSTRGELLTRKGDLANAERDLSLALEVDPVNGAAWELRGKVRALRLELADAIQDFARAIELDPRDAEAWCGRGHALSQKGDYEAALSDLSRAIELDSRFAHAFHVRGKTYHLRKESEAAIADFTKALELDPGNVDALNERGVCEEETGNLEGAILDLTKAIELDPKNPGLHANRGNAYTRQGDQDKAIEDYTAGIKLAPDDAKLRAARGSARVSQGDFQGALKDLDKAVAIDSCCVAALSDRGIARYELKRLEGAFADQSRAIELDPKNPAHWANRGNVRMRNHDNEGAVKDLTRAIELGSQIPLVWNNRGCAWQNLNDLEKAIADLTRAIELSPRYLDAWCNRARCYRDKGDFEAAIKDASRAIELAPKNPSAWQARGSSYQKKGEPKLALADLDRSIKLHPRMGPAFFYRGLAKRDLGDVEGAKKDLKAYLEMAPAGSFAPVAKEELSKLE